mgnify:CR=1 FL=1
MPILYYLKPNTRGTSPSYSPVTTAIQAANFEALIATLSQKHGLDAAKLGAAISDLGPAIAAQIIENHSVSVPNLAEFRPLITDATVSAPDAPLPATATGDASIKIAGAMKSVLSSAHFERQAAPDKAPQWKTVAPSFEGTSLEALQPGDGISVVGANLDFTASRADEGVFFRRESDGSAVKTTRVTVHTAQKLDFLVPSGLAAGEEYRVELHTRGDRATQEATLQIYVCPVEVKTAP